MDKCIIQTRIPKLSCTQTLVWTGLHNSLYAVCGYSRWVSRPCHVNVSCHVNHHYLGHQSVTQLCHAVQLLCLNGISYELFENLSVTLLWYLWVCCLSLCLAWICFVFVCSFIMLCSTLWLASQCELRVCASVNTHLHQTTRFLIFGASALTPVNID